MKRGADSEKRAFREALKRGVGRCVLQLMTGDLLRECLYDCNEDVRRYAARLLKRRRRSRPVH